MTETTTPATNTDRAAEFLVVTLSEYPDRRAPSFEIRERCSFNREALRRARERLGVRVTSGSLPGRPYVTWWQLPDQDQLERKQLMGKIQGTHYDRATILAYNAAYLAGDARLTVRDETKSVDENGTPGLRSEKVTLTQLPVSRDNLNRIDLDEIDLPGVFVYEAGPR